MRDGYSITAAETLLDWYDVNARDLPWRIAPQSGGMADPYQIWLSEIMLQQTTVAAVKDYFRHFITRWPTVHDLANAQDKDVMGAWAGLGYYARARNLLKSARLVVSEFGGNFPDTNTELQKLPGIGPYTGAAIAAIAFGHPETVVDGNVERVMARVFDIHTPLPTAKPEFAKRAERLTPMHRSGDYAQALMDLGAGICTPRNPICQDCPWQTGCLALERGTMADLPKKLPKKKKPTRFGIAYIAQRPDGALLMERRPDKGLLGGMLGWPGSQWCDAPLETPPFNANWQQIEGEVRHTFTHFHLRLSVKLATFDNTIISNNFQTMRREDFRRSDLPTVMRKAYDHAHDTLVSLRA